jgi:hypothetical protein
VDACTAAAPDAITAFAVPNPSCSSQSQSVFSGLVARQVASPSESPGLLQIGQMLFRSTFSAVDDCRLFLPNRECSDGNHKFAYFFALFCGKLERTARCSRCGLIWMGDAHVDLLKASSERDLMIDRTLSMSGIRNFLKLSAFHGGHVFLTSYVLANGAGRSQHI